VNLGGVAVGLQKSMGFRKAVVVFGASGSLATTKLMPAIERLTYEGAKPRRIFTIGVDLKPPPRASSREWFAHVQGDLTHMETYDALSSSLRGKLARTGADCTYYLATGPQLFPRVVDGLEHSGLNHAATSRRILVEKPFGTSLRSSKKLQKRLDLAFGKTRVYRVDHFLAKTGVREIVRTRLANPELEGALNGDCVDHVQVMADESQGIEGRAGFYDKVGDMRDMVQNHMLQVLCQVAMEPPRSDASRQRDDTRASLLKRVDPIRSDDIVWGQYSGYRLADGVRSGSRTPTFVALKLFVGNGRWRGVPFYLRTGRKLRRNLTRVLVVFKKPLDLEFRGRRYRLGFVSFGIDPIPSLTGGLIRFKGTGEPIAASVEEIRTVAPQDEYELLLRGALDGNHSLFVGDRFNELAWKLVDPPIKELEDGHSSLQRYAAATGGPVESESLLTTSGRAWL